MTPGASAADPRAPRFFGAVVRFSTGAESSTRDCASSKLSDDGWARRTDSLRSWRRRWLPMVARSGGTSVNSSSASSSLLLRPNALATPGGRSRRMARQVWESQFLATKQGDTLPPGGSVASQRGASESGRTGEFCAPRRSPTPLRLGRSPSDGRPGSLRCGQTRIHHACRRAPHTLSPLPACPSRGP